MDLIKKKKDFLQITQAETLAIRDFDSNVLDNSISFPLGELASLGALFAALPNAFANVVQANGVGKLYEAIYPAGCHLAQEKGGVNFLGAIVKDGKGVVGQARFKEVQGAAQGATQAAGVSMMFMALAIMAINKSLKDISENQKSIMSFLEVDKESKLKADVIVLSDIIEDYQHNWNNEQYRTNREMQILDVKRDAEQNILFYREMIEKKLSKKSFVHIDTTKILSEIQNKFRYYKLSVYLYAFSSFLDILLLENFDSTYLKSVMDKISLYSKNYDDFFQENIVKIEDIVSSSIQSRTLQGLAVAGKFAGEQIAKIPDKDNKIKIDDKLISGSDKIDKYNKDAIAKTITSFTSVEDSGIKMFTEKISLIDRMYNKPIRLVFDSEKLYLLNADKAS